MRLLIDENLSPMICPLVEVVGHDAVHVRDLGLTSALDEVVLASARQSDRVLVTADRGDFGRLTAATSAPGPSVVLLRQLPAVVRAADVAALLAANLTDRVADSIDQGAFVVLTPTAVRVRPLPLQ